MSIEVNNARNIGKGITSKNPLPPRANTIKRTGKIRGKAAKPEREVVDGEVIDPTPVRPVDHEPEVYDGTIVETLPGARKSLSAPPRMIQSTRITPIPALPAPKKNKKAGYKQQTIPGMGRTAQFKSSTPPSA